MAAGRSSPGDLDGRARTRDTAGVPTGRARLTLLAALATATVTRGARADEPATAAPAAAALEEYDRLSIGYDLFLGRVVSMHQGRDRPPLADEALYRALERPDLLRRYERRQAARILLGVVGVGAVIGGFWYLGAHACDSAFDVNGNPCDDRRSFAIGIAVVLAGGGALAASIPTWRTASPEELRAAADEHNRQLRARLGLAPVALSGGGGAVVTGTF
jgi:hypothetical protein